MAPYVWGAALALFLISHDFIHGVVVCQHLDREYWDPTIGVLDEPCGFRVLNWGTQGFFGLLVLAIVAGFGDEDGTEESTTPSKGRGL